jgi:hypothetical protein
MLEPKTGQQTEEGAGYGGILLSLVWIWGSKYSDKHENTIGGQRFFNKKQLLRLSTYPIIYPLVYLRSCRS